nr:TonB-dependent receptor [Sphingomonas lycopersici]
MAHATSSLLVLVLASAAHAQAGTGVPPAVDDAARPAAVQDIVVTAEKRSESLQKTPISIVALTSAALETRNINGLNDLRSVVPNLQLTPHPNSGGTTQVFMRGVGLNDDQITQDPSVAIYVDGVYVARSQGLATDIADLERVEVLRGPQGTLYGRNATGGAINFITRRPTLGQWGGRITLDAGNYDYRRVKGSINVPIGQTIAIDLSYLGMGQHGFVKNAGTQVARFGDKDRHALRADALWKPSNSFSLRYVYDRSIIDDTPAFIAAVPLFPAVADRPTTGAKTVSDLLRNHITSQGHALTGEWQPTDDITVRSITAYRELSNFQNENYLAGVLRPQPLQRNRGEIHQHQFSEELQLLGKLFGDQLNYVVGGYYFSENGRSSSANLPTTTTVTTYGGNSIDNSAFAAFGQVSWTPALAGDRLHFTIGARYSRDRREATKTQATQTGSGPIINTGSGAGQRVFHDFSPSFILAFDAAPGVNLYAKAVRGYKSGGFNLRASSIARFEQGFAPENLWSYELGAKTLLFDNSLRVNVAAFTSDYRDIQVNVQSDPTNIRITDVLNAGAATVKGVEADVALVPLRGLTLSANYGYLDARYDRIRDASGADVTSQFRFINAPHNSFSLEANYETPRFSFGRLAGDVNYNWQSKEYSVSSVTGGAYIIGSRGLLNARLTLSDMPLVKGVKISLFGQNLTDRKYYVAHFNAGAPAAIFGEPRTYGIELTGTF